MIQSGGASILKTGTHSRAAGTGKKQRPPRARNATVDVAMFKRFQGQQEKLQKAVRQLQQRHEAIGQLQQRVAEVETALAQRGMTLAEIDAENAEELTQYYEAGRLRRATVLINQEMKTLRALGLVDKRGNRVKKEIPADMREGSTCDL